MVLSFVRKLNMSPGLRDTGDVIDADDITELQVALEGVHNDPFGDASGTLPAVLTDLRASADGIQDGTLPIALAGIEGALGQYEPLQNMRHVTVNVRDFAANAIGDNWTAAFVAAYASLPDASLGVTGGGTIIVPPGRYELNEVALTSSKPVSIVKEGGTSRRMGHYSSYSAGDAVLVGMDSGANSAVFSIKDGGNGYGFQWRSLSFDLQAGTEAAIHALNVSGGLVEDCIAVGPSTQTTEQWMIRGYCDTSPGADASWWRVNDNQTNRVALAYVGGYATYSHNNWGFIGNTVFPGTYVDTCIRLIHCNRTFTLGNNLEPSAISTQQYGMYLDHCTQGTHLGDCGESSYVGSVFLKAVACNGNLFAPMGFSLVTDASNKIIEDDGQNILIAPSANGAGTMYSGPEQSRVTHGNVAPLAGLFANGLASSAMASVVNPMPYGRWSLHNPQHDIGGLTAEYWDGASWSSWAPTDVKNLSADNTASISIDATHKKCRFRLGGTAQPDWPLIVAKFRPGTGAPVGTVAVTVEAIASDGTTVQSAWDSTVALSASTEGVSFPLPYIAGTYVRVTLDTPVTGSETINLSRVACYTARVGDTNGKNVPGRTFKGAGDPNSAIYGGVGDLWLRTDGGAGSTLYVKESGNNTTTGWVAK